jgi:cell division transport system ATP-binding protein
MIELENVSFHYEASRSILKNVSLKIEPGSFHFLLGESGAGKSTLLGLLSGRKHPQRGTVKLFGNNLLEARDHVRQKIRQHIALIHQDTYLVPTLNILENVGLPLMALGEEEASFRDNVIELLDWVGLGHQVFRYPSSLSVGERQRAGIARACIMRPDIILADEPTGNLDPDLALRVLRLFAELNHMGTTMIVATHDILLVDQFPFPILFVGDGKIGTNRPKQAK